MNRRSLIQLIGLAATPFATACAPRRTPPGVPREEALAEPPGSLMAPPSGPPLQIAMVAYAGMTALDLVGPQLFLGSLLGVDVHVVAKTREPVVCDTGLAIVPSATFADMPAQVDVLFVGGGTQGTALAMRDPGTLEFLRTRGAAATWVTSVCTGALVLGAAGLLRGYRATTHWVAHDLLATVGATPVDERVVTDRNRITAAGVSAGLDLGLQLAITLRGERYARAVALNAEYAPAPPLEAGTPRTAGPEATRLLREMYAPLLSELRAAATEAR